MDNRIAFNDACLQQAANRAAPKLAGFTTILNEISDDIKRLEAWLGDQGICIPISLKVEKEAFLRWDKSDERWRLFYHIYWDNDEYEPPHSELRPLIEMPADIRLQMRKFLPQFVERVASRLPGSPAEPLNFVIANADDYVLTN